MTLPPAGSRSPTRMPDPRPVPFSVYAVFLPVWVFVMIAVAMGAATWESSWAGVAVLGVLVYPGVVLVSTLASRRAVRAGRPGAARAWNLLPMPWVVAGSAFMVWALS